MGGLGVWEPCQGNSHESPTSATHVSVAEVMWGKAKKKRKEAKQGHGIERVVGTRNLGAC